MKIALPALIALVLLLPAAAHADATITATCNGTPCAAGWYTANVHVSFLLPAGSSNPQGCGDQDVTADTGGTTFSCSVVVTGSQCCRLDVTVKRDATPPTATAVSLARGPDSNGWYNHPVDATATGTDALSGIASCTTTTYSGPDAASATVASTCRDNAGNVSAPVRTTFAYDATPPGVTASAARGPDAGGWYNHPVAVAFSGTDAGSGLDSCTSATYGGPDTDAASVSGTCKDKAGNTGSTSVTLKYDATPPTANAATPDRPPDAGGAYNHPVKVTFAGADGASGVASCDAPTYSRPDSASAAVSGRCTDNAGNVSAPFAFALRYDSTPPSLKDLLITTNDRSVTLAWKVSADAAAIKVLRARGGAAARVTLYDGKRLATYTDKRIVIGDKYTYTVEAVDAAGNVASESSAAAPSAPLIAPRQAARVRGGVSFRWRATAHATYYNVQIWRDGKKILSAWPAGTTYHAPRLTPGRYSWIVWPGFGARTRHRYGGAIGKSTFVITR
jgi:hypothetical protein